MINFSIMQRVFTEEELDALWEEAHQQGNVSQNFDGIEHRREVLPELGKGETRNFRSPHGLQLSVINGELRQELKVKVQWPDASSAQFVSKFYLSGNSRVISPGFKGVKADYEEISRHHYLYYLPEVQEIEQWPEEVLIQVAIVETTSEFWRSLNSDLDSVPQTLRRSLTGNPKDRFHQSLGTITHTMRQVSQQILDCPFHGATKQIYLEAKAMELVALQLEIWREDAQPQHSPALKPDDIECLYHARDILIRQMDDPPSLLHLARQVGINDRKLKQGFRQLFDTTVFGYLNNYRLERSRLMLLEGRKTVAQVALAVGYAHPGYFAAAFKRKFGVSPKAYQIVQLGKNSP